MGMLSNCGHISTGEAGHWKGWENTYAEVLEQVAGLEVDVQAALVGQLGEVESGDLGNVLILALTLLLLKLEGDTADGTTLDTAHQMGGVTSNLQDSQVSLLQFP